MSRLGLVDHCFEVAAGDPLGALLVAVRATRWQLLAAGELHPDPDEVIPAEVWRAREQLARDVEPAVSDGRRYAWFRVDRQAA